MHDKYVHLQMRSGYKGISVSLRVMELNQNLILCL